MYPFNKFAAAVLCLVFVDQAQAVLVEVTITGTVQFTRATLPSVQRDDPVTAIFIIDTTAPGLDLSGPGPIFDFEGDHTAYRAGIISGSVSIGESVNLPYALDLFRDAPGVLVRNDSSLVRDGQVLQGPLDELRFGGNDPDPAQPQADELQIDGIAVYGYSFFFQDQTSTAFSDSSLANVLTATFGDFEFAGAEIYSGPEIIPDRLVSIGLDGYSAEIVPIPAAAWLFGSALGLLGWLKRRTG